MLLGIDIGGTFTDFVFIDATPSGLSRGQPRIFKRLTTPDDPSRGLLAGVRSMALPPDEEIDLVHGSTIATNALLERKGARTALITTRGFGDVLQIGRQTRPDLYDLQPRKPEPLVPRRWRYEVSERVGSDGTVVTPLALDEIERIAAHLVEEGIESVAVCLLFSFLHPAHEQAIRRRLVDTPAGDNPLFVSLSSEVLPEFREYERTSATVINAYVAPLMARYLARLETGLAGQVCWTALGSKPSQTKYRLRIMQSNGGVISAGTAATQAARTALSGPAGGVVGAFHVAGLSGYERVITFDMGGTSTDVALCDGGVPTTSDGEIGGLPLRLPMIDIHTVGAGGGSLAEVDPGGALTVGPQSAGADPGPVCYGRGSGIATTTDANLILGRLDPSHFLGGEMALDAAPAVGALQRLAGRMKVDSTFGAAWGVIQVANATMERAIRRISVERGHDPRRFALLAFGGAGPLHACDLAGRLNIPTVLVPRTPGVLSALGMLVADLVKDYSQTVMLRAGDVSWGELEGHLEPLKRRGKRELTAEGVPPGGITLDQALDMRYVGQSHEMTVPVERGDDVAAAFHRAHGRRFGHQHPDESVEIVNVRVIARGGLAKPRFPTEEAGGADAAEARIGAKGVFFGPEAPVTTQLYERGRLRAGNQIRGPAIIFQLDTTTVIPPTWGARVDRYGTLVITRTEDS
jgi:N-methylhydantoinase A